MVDHLGFCHTASIVVAALTPGLLIYETDAEGEIYVAVDEGCWVKTGTDVLVSVRRALSGTDLGQLRTSVGAGISDRDEHEQSVAPRS